MRAELLLLCLFATLWTVALQAPLCMGFWSGLPFPSPRDLLNPGSEPTSLMSPALAGGFFTTSTTWEVENLIPRNSMENQMDTQTGAACLEMLTRNQMAHSC